MLRLLSLPLPADLNEELARIGVDPAAWDIFLKKKDTLAIKIPDLSVAGANILKQTALAIGADCAVHRLVISGKVRQSDCILFATRRQIENLCQRLEHQPACVRKVVPELTALINALQSPDFSLTIRGRKFDLRTRTYLMGILNVTPDSFYDGGRFLEPAKALERVQQLVEEGADIIDIGAESTRPGSEPVPPTEQLKRLLPVLKMVRKKVKVPISIDTTSARVADVTLKEGADIVNDISGLNFDPKMRQVVARAGVPVIIMHIKGKPRTMQQNPVYQDLMREIIAYLKRAIQRATAAGIARGKILIDPGIGFGKTLKHNLTILRRLPELRSLGRPIVVGPSRKSFIGMVLDLPPEERLEGTIAASVIAAEKGASIIRVHDVVPVKRALAIRDAISGNLEA